MRTFTLLIGLISTRVSDSVSEICVHYCRNTSGIVLLTRHADAAKNIATLFREHKIIKKYWSVECYVTAGVQCVCVSVHHRAITVGEPAVQR